MGNEVYIDKILLAISLAPKRSISPEELLVIIGILFLNKAMLDVTIKHLAEYVKCSETMIDDSLNALQKRKYLCIKTRKAKLEFDLRGYFEADETQPTFDQNIHQVAEEAFGRPLSPSELSTLMALNAKYSFEDMQYALREMMVNKKTSMPYVSKILSTLNTND